MRVAAGVVVALIGIAIGFGAVQLWNGAPASWSDVTASEPTVMTVARTMITVAALMVAAGTAAVVGARWGRPAAAVMTTVFVVGGFWANAVLFGSIRLTHTGVNIVVAALVVWLLWH
jgi:hypothetical protein